MNELKKENKILQESNWRFLGQMDLMKMELRERGEEVISLRIKQDRQNNSIRELEEVGFSLHLLYTDLSTKQLHYMCVFRNHNKIICLIKAES